MLEISRYSPYQVIVATSFGGHSEQEPPDPIPNSEVKLLCANDSVGFPYAKVGHRQFI